MLISSAKKMSRARMKMKELVCSHERGLEFLDAYANSRDRETEGFEVSTAH